MLKDFENYVINIGIRSFLLFLIEFKQDLHFLIDIFESKNKIFLIRFYLKYHKNLAVSCSI